MTQHILDARNLLCPMPVIRLQSAIAQYQPGDTVEIWCTDPGAEQDIPAWCNIHGHQVNGIVHEDYEIKLLVQVGP